MMSKLNSVHDRKLRPFQNIIDVKSGFQSLIRNPNERLQELNPITTTTERSTTSINSLPSTKLDSLITITEDTSTENTMVIMYILLIKKKVNYIKAKYKSQGLLSSTSLKSITALKSHMTCYYLNLNSFFTNLKII